MAKELAEMGWADYIPTALRAPIEIYRKRHLIQHLWTLAQAKLGMGRTAVVVLGRSGSGKSFLAAQMHGVGNQLDWVDPGVSSEVETHPIEIGAWTRLVRVIPGGNSLERASGMYQAFQKENELEGIIYVACAGYTELRDDVMKRRFENQGLDSIEKFREDQMKREVEDFQKVCDRILEIQALGIKPKFLYVLINKLDLYIDDIEAVQSHYDVNGTGGFAKLLREFQREADTQSLAIRVSPVCATMKTFQWGKESVRPQIGSIEEQKNSIRLTLEALGKLIDRRVA